jgi:RHS repeat-associated protein
MGELSSSVAPKGNVAGADPADFTTSYTYNSDGQVLTVTDPLGHVTTTGYDADGNVHTVTDPNNHTTTTDYNENNQPVTITRPDTTTLTSTYDNDGNQLTQTNGAGKTTTYTFDPLNRLASSTDPDNRTTTYTYDLAGNQQTVTNPAGKITTKTYDNANRLTGISYSDGTTPSVSMGYDADGQRTSMTDGTGTSSWSYDSLHRMTSNSNGGGLSVGYSYDLANNVTTITYPDGQVVTDSYDNAGQMTGVKDWFHRTTGFGYDPDGNLTSQTNPNSTTVSYDYDNADQAISVTADNGGTLQASFTRTPDPAGLTTAITNDGAGVSQPSQTYGYNSLDQLISNNSNTMGYDNAGNLTTLDNGTTLTYDNASQLQTASPSTGVAVSYGYNPQGDRTSITPAGGTATTLGYDQDDRLTSYTSPTVSASYTYNGDGLRMSKTVAGTTTQFAYDTSGALPLVLTDDTYKNLYGPDGLPFAQVNNSGITTWLLHDLQGSTRVLENNNGVINATYTYTPYGDVSKKTGSNTTPLQYTGQYTDSETGYQYLRARYYDPTTTNFLTLDPLVSITGDPYSYTSGDPIDGNDPTGLWPHKPHWLNLQNIADASAAFGDTVSFGLTRKVRQHFGYDNVINYCSGWYTGGQIAGYAALAATGAGAEGAAAARGIDAAVVDVDELASSQLSNYARYLKGLPKGADYPRITRLADGSVEFSADVPATNIPGSYATYTKIIGSDGSTISYYKTTIAPDGSVISVKVKYP